MEDLAVRRRHSSGRGTGAKPIIAAIAALMAIVVPAALAAAPGDGARLPARWQRRGAGRHHGHIRDGHRDRCRAGTWRCSRTAVEARVGPRVDGPPRRLCGGMANAEGDHGQDEAGDIPWLEHQAP